MNKITGLALLVAGIVLITYGINASNSIGSDLSRAFTGSPTDKTLWLLIGGIVATVVGAEMTFIGPGKFHKSKRKEIVKAQIKGLCLLLCLTLAGAAATTFSGCAGSRYERSTGQYIDDKSLTLRVHNALADNPDYKFGDVNVIVFRGTVQLSGFVNNPDQKSKAAEIAKHVQGVKDVENKISVKEKL